MRTGSLEVVNVRTGHLVYVGNPYRTPRHCRSPDGFFDSLGVRTGSLVDVGVRTGSLDTLSVRSRHLVYVSVLAGHLVTLGFLTGSLEA